MKHASFFYFTFSALLLLFSGALAGMGLYAFNKEVLFNFFASGLLYFVAHFHRYITLYFAVCFMLLAALVIYPFVYMVKRVPFAFYIETIFL